MRTVEVIFFGLVTLAIINILFFAKNSPAVIKSVFGGTTQLFGTLVSPGGSQGYQRSISGNF